MAVGSKNINIMVSIECWKELKKISIDKDVTLQKVVQDILEKAMSRKVKQDVVEIN